jgi:hypothetical protein
MSKSICDNCIHDKVCGEKGHRNPAMKVCAHRLGLIDSTPTISGHKFLTSDFNIPPYQKGWNDALDAIIDTIEEAENDEQGSN